MNPVNLFVYGTLLAEKSNHYLLEDSEFLGERTTAAEYTMISNGHFPIVKMGGNTAIHGELYKITSEKVLNQICQLEGYHGVKDPRNWYELALLPGDEKAHIFLMAPEFAPNWQVIESGKFK